MLLKCIQVSQEKDFKEVVLSETVRLVPAGEVTLSPPTAADPEGNKRQHVTHTLVVTLSTTDSARFGKYVEGSDYKLEL